MARPTLLFVFLFSFLTATSLRGQSFDKTLPALQSAEQKSQSNAKNWSRENGFPMLQHLADESLVGVQGFQEGMPVFFTTHNQRAGSLTRTSNLHPGQVSGFDLSGLNLVIGMWDASPAFNGHQEHRSRIVQKETGGVSNHATHVAGTLVASGINSESLGMAPQAKVHSYNWNFHATEMLVEAREGLLVSNHSYGRIAGWHKFNLTADSSRWQWFGDPTVSLKEDYIFGYYDQDASLFDHVTHTYPYFLPVVSAGNERDDLGAQTGIYLALDTDNRWREYTVADRPIAPDGSPEGFDTLTGIATAKNALTVGSVVQVDAFKIPAISVFSSAGPTDDGRIKPDLVGIGENLYSTVATGISDYDSYSGTSMATPNIAGSLILLQQLAKQLLGGPLRAATLKGLAIHTATDLELPGPDYYTGWGLLNAEKAALHIQSTFRNPTRILEERLSSEESFAMELLSIDTQDIRVTLSWTDPPFTPIKKPGPELLDNPTSTLVHDLNLKVVNLSTKEEFFPFKLAVNTPELPASRGINTVDPLEQIYIPQAQPGMYALVVTADRKLTTDFQDFSLIISGMEEPVSPVVIDTVQIDAAFGNVAFNWQTLAENASGTFLIERSDIEILNRDGTQSTHFEQIASLDATGDGRNRTAYHYTDKLFLKGDYRYRVLFLEDGVTERILLAEFDVNLPAPPSFAIASIYPNPMQSAGTLILDLPEGRFLEVAIYNTIGQRMAIISEQRYDAGRHFIDIDPTSWSEGMYFVVIRSEGLRMNSSFALIK